MGSAIGPTESEDGNMANWRNGDDFVVERCGRQYTVFVARERVGVKIVESGREYTATFPHRRLVLTGGGHCSPVVAHRMREARNVAADALGECWASEMAN